jgi:anti-anti-sigma factor
MKRISMDTRFHSGGITTMPIAQTEPWFLLEPEVMEITGRLDDATAPITEEDALLCIRSGARRMVIDGRNLTYVSGAGMRALLTLARVMQRAGGRLVACTLQPQVAEMFAASGFHAIIPVYNDRDEAIAALAG